MIGVILKLEGNIKSTKALKAFFKILTFYIIL